MQGTRASRARQREKKTVARAGTVLGGLLSRCETPCRGSNTGPWEVCIRRLQPHDRALGIGNQFVYFKT